VVESKDGVEDSRGGGSIVARKKTNGSWFLELLFFFFSFRLFLSLLIKQNAILVVRSERNGNYRF
jgi:hypothetical protein